MYCENCGGRVANEARFCNKCGREIDYNIRDHYVKQMGSKDDREVASKKKKAKLKILIGTSLFVFITGVIVALNYLEDYIDLKEDSNVSQNESATYPLQETVCTTEESGCRLEISY